ncbi:DUF5994 family protein [Yinghuangia aomiensis]
MSEPTAAGADRPGRTASSLRLPRLPRLALEVPSTGRGMFDGAWWPRSDDATGELPDLVAAISAYAGRVVRVGIHRPHWRRIPHTVLISGNLPVRVSSVSTTAHTVVLTRSLRDQVLLLVVPPDTETDVAWAAMAAAATADSRTSAMDLLQAPR